MVTVRNIRLVPLLAVMVLLSFAPVNNSYRIGDKVNDFSLKNVDGKIVSTEAYKNGKGLIVVFTCNHCPFAKKYQQRLNALNKKFAEKGFPLLAVSSNDVLLMPEDSYENMIVRAREEHYNFPYLYDEKQSVARAFGAAKTPHAFVLSKEKDKWTLRYSGAIDDNGSEPENATSHYVEDAVNALLQGKPVAIPETKSIGCPIKLKNA